ncbi:MAG TPA: response regulator [Burkholderiaceae bacterium]|nr:response regulator [Burkholderiaceae bacterium]
MALMLVIEDNATNLELMTYLLHAWGHETVTAEDGTTGLELARSTEPDLIICDIQMPRTDGYEVARVLKADAALKQVPLVAVTAFAMVGDEEKSLQAGFDAHIAKPIDPRQFMAVLERLLPPAGGRPPKPMAGTADAPPPPEIDEALRAPRPGLTILLVDDTAANLEFKVSLLEPAGYAVRAAAGGAEALAIARRERVDLIVSDVVMAHGGGFDLLDAVRADPALHATPFLFLTATARDSVSQARGLALGAEAYLLRPIEPQFLLGEIRRHLSGR